MPEAVEKFKEDVTWRLRVLNYNGETGELITEIIDYHAQRIMDSEIQTSLQFPTIGKIKFRSIDTGQLLSAVQFKSVNNQIISDSGNDIRANNHYQLQKVTDRTLLKTMKVPIHKLQFLYARVSFSLFVEELGTEIKFEIGNNDIRPEFEAIKDYFARTLKKKLIAVDIEILYNTNRLLSAKARSDDVQKINNTLIDSVKFEFVKREIISLRAKNRKVVYSILWKALRIHLRQTLKKFLIQIRN